MLTSFPPVINQCTRVLIIGSMPGEASLRAEQYYAYKHNQFWKIMSDLFYGGKPFHSYNEKLQLLLKNGVGLWDTLRACERQGSLDSHIRQAMANDFPALLSSHPLIQTLLFNGQTAHNYFVKFFGQLPGLTYQVLPSTSPAHAAVSYQEKFIRWKEAVTRALSV